MPGENSQTGQATNLGAATAYGYAKAGGYTGTEAQFESLMANVGNTAQAATTQALKSEGFAVGQQNGTDVQEGSPYYENNAEHWAGVAEDAAEELETAITDINNVKNAVEELEAGSLSALYAENEQIPMAKGDGTWDWGDGNQLIHYFFPCLEAGGYSGHSALVKTPEKTLIMDCGPTSDWEDIKAYYDDLYEAEIFTNIDYIIISHYHYDHYQNLQSILQTYPHEGCKVLMPMRLTGYRSDASDFDTTINSLISKIQAEECEYEIVDEATTIHLDSYGIIDLELFNSTPADYAYYSNLESDYNNYSMVALIRHGSIYAMFPGDIERDAQVRICATRDLPRLFLYSVHHHGIQNDDYHNYLFQINPIFNVIMTSHNRMLSSAKSSSAGNFLTGKMGSTAYSSYHYVSWKNGGDMVYGMDTYRIGWYYAYQTYYVDNEYDGGIYDGTQEHPFTDINEALSFVDQRSNLHYRIRVQATSTRYPMLWVRDFNYPIEIIGVKKDGVNPTVNGCYVRSSRGVSFTNITFDSPGQESSWCTELTEMQIWSSDVVFSACVFDGINCSGDISGMVLREANVYLTSSCKFANLNKYAITTDRYASVTSNNTQFENVNVCYNSYVLMLALRGLDKLTNVTKWIKGNGTRTFSLDIPYGCYKTQHLNLIDDDIVSNPFYVDADNPVCIIQGKQVRKLDAPLTNGKILGLSAKDDASESSLRVTTNSNGTTINTTSYTGSVTITQTVAPNATATDYRNGYITIGVTNMTPDKEYRFQADAVVSQNIIPSDKVRVLPQGKTTGASVMTDITNGKIDCTFTYKLDASHPTYSFLEFRVGGKSMTLSNIEITPT